MNDISKIQQALKQQKLDGWLLADFHGRNSVAVEILKLSGIVTRRSFYFIPAEGEPVALVSPIEKEKFAKAAGRVVPIAGYKNLELKLKSVLSGCNRVAMEYAPMGRLPYIGLVDAGTIELVRSFGIEIVSSADLVASFGARLSCEQIESHYRAAKKLIEIKSAAHDYIRTALQDGDAITEYDVQEFILRQFEQNGMVTQFPPNCSVDANAGNPHYEPSADNSAAIKLGSLVLIDLWAKFDEPHGIYADITWMAYAGTASDIPARYNDIFRIVCAARDAAVRYLKDHFDHGALYGADADDACRKVIEDAGYGESFTHRTGHSITTSEHGSGPNIDNLETEDKRALQPGHLFSVEPGIYTSDIGFRTEINVLMTEDGPEITTLPLQNEIVALL
ncbi:MAG: M24 family metallopeptidase [bacterium]